LKIRENLLDSNSSSGLPLSFAISFGGGKIGSKAIFKAFSTIAGIILARRGQDN